MGRYYNTSSGREGKFMFGVQPSDDPEFFGMCAGSVQYYADESNEPEIKKKLDELYDELEVPKDKRIYYFKEYEDLDKFENEYLYPKCFVSVKNDDEKEKEKHKGEGAWASYKGDEYTDYQIGNRALTLARIRLGLTVLSDIKDDGFCDLDAEL